MLYIILVTTILFHVLPFFTPQIAILILVLHNLLSSHFFIEFFSVDSWITIVLFCIIHTYLESYFQDDDSDLDCELEALPSVSAESASEAAACVKVNVITTFSLNVLGLASYILLILSSYYQTCIN